MKSKWRAVGASCLSAYLLTHLLLPLCSAIFQCGCTWECEGADEFCNVRQPAPPHCPWCAQGWWGWHLPLGMMLLATLATMLATHRHWKDSPFTWLSLSVLCWEVWPLVAGAISGWWASYPHFLYWTWPT